MAATYNGATREEFVGRVRAFSKKEIEGMMREAGKSLPKMPAKASHDDFVGACFDMLVGAARTPSEPAEAAPRARWAVRSRSRTERHRCGHRFTNKLQEFPANAFTPAELAALKADPLIEVRDLMRRGG